jgi:hypothetical protein
MVLMSRRFLIGKLYSNKVSGSLQNEFGRRDERGNKGRVEGVVSQTDGGVVPMILRCCQEVKLPRSERSRDHGVWGSDADADKASCPALYLSEKGEGRGAENTTPDLLDQYEYHPQ